MNKRNVYIIALGLFIATVVLIILRYNNRQMNEEDLANYTLLPRKGESAKMEEWKNIRLQAAELIKAIQENKDDIKSILSLATLFIKEARVTGNFTYYDKAALLYVNNVLRKEPSNFEALVLKSLLYLSQHHFAEGLRTAQQARDINPYNSFVYGILVDGNVEMGYYDSAVHNAQVMVNIRPDLRSYSRVSYLREIYGDYPGAIEVMKWAVEAGPPGDESTEWARCQLGQLYENSGDIQNAQFCYQTSLNYRPDYPYALAGIARIAIDEKDYKRAINLYSKADSSITDFSIREAWGEAYKLAGERKKGEALEKNVIAEMTAEAESGKRDENTGHYVDKELAYAYLNLNSFDKALEHALIEYNRRPDNIDVNEAVAWVYYCNGEYQKAVPYINTALKTHSKNPTLLCRAGLIFAKAGDRVLANRTLQQALKTNANIAVNLKSEGLNVLQMLESSPFPH